MAIANARDVLLKAAEEKYAVGAFNITNLIQMEAVVEAAAEEEAPVIIQTSVTPSKFLKPHVLVAIYRALASSVPIPVVLHLDHCQEVDYCKQCADLGYTNIMIDASHDPFEENVRQTKEVCDYCHALGDISVEGELGRVVGVEDEIVITEDEAVLCDPDQAVEFVERTGVDLLAPAIGTAHGVYQGEPNVDVDRLSEINRRLNGGGARIPLVIHGGSGLPDKMVRKLVENGGTKLNVSTYLKQTLIDTTFEYVQDHPDEYNPGAIDAAVKEAIKDLIKGYIDLLGCAGKAE